MPTPTQFKRNPQWPFLAGSPRSVTVYTDVVSGTVIFGGSVAEFTTSPPAAFSPAQVKLNPNPQWPFWVAAPAIAPPVVTTTVYSDAVTGAIIFGGSVAEGKVGADPVTGAIIFGGSVAEFATSPPPAFAPAQILPEPNPQWPFKLGAPPQPPGPAVYQDSVTGALIFGGSLTEGKTGTDVSSGSIIFGGSATESKVGADPVTGAIIFGGSVYEFTTSPPPAFSPTQVKLNPNPQWPFWVPAPAVAPAPVSTVVIYTDSVTGAIIFSGSVVESRVTGAKILYIQNQLFRKMP